MGSPLNPNARPVGKRKGGSHAQRIDEAVQVALQRSSRDGRRPKTVKWGDQEVAVTATRLDQVSQAEIVETVARVKRELGLS